MNLRTYADDAAFVKVFERILANAGDIAGDILRSELGVACIALVFFNMDGGEYILHYEALVKENSVLVIVALPCHKADKDILAEGYLAV